MRQQTNSELLALYEDNTSNIQFLKEQNFKVLASYTAIAAFVISQKFDFSHFKAPILLVLIFGAAFCSLIIVNNQAHLKRRRDILSRVRSQFSDLYDKCRGEKSKCFEHFDDYIFWVSLIYPFVVWWIMHFVVIEATWSDFIAMIKSLCIARF